VKKARTGKFFQLGKIKACSMSVTHKQQSYNINTLDIPGSNPAFANMLSKHQILSLLLALTLLGSYMAFSGHISSHTTTDPGLCALCLHPGKPDTAINPELTVFTVVPASFTLTQKDISPLFLPVILHDHQSRAPPPVS
jgi:hypothetical protein